MKKDKKGRVARFDNAEVGSGLKNDHYEKPLTCSSGMYHFSWKVNFS